MLQIDLIALEGQFSRIRQFDAKSFRIPVRVIAIAADGKNPNRLRFKKTNDEIWIGIV